MIFSPLDLFLIFIVGVLIGAMLWNRRMKGKSERPIARLLSAILEPIYYWTDARGADGRPSLSKVSYLLGLGVALVILVLFALQEQAHEAVSNEQHHDVSLGFLGYAALVLSYALGKQVFNAFIASKLGDKLPDVLKARASGGHVTPERPPGQSDRAGDRRADSPGG